MKRSSDSSCAGSSFSCTISLAGKFASTLPWKPTTCSTLGVGHKSALSASHRSNPGAM
jgi:hypothetical protein